MRTLFELGTTVGSLAWSLGPALESGVTTTGIAAALGLTLLSLLPTADRLARTAMSLEEPSGLER
jgi:hypothetical protein